MTRSPSDYSLRARAGRQVRFERAERLPALISNLRCEMCAARSQWGGPRLQETGGWDVTENGTVVPMKRIDCWRRAREICGGRARALAIAAMLAAVAGATTKPDCAAADEGGVGFWLPGQLGTLAAVPQTPGWNVGIIDYYTSISASGNVAAARQVTIGKLAPNVFVNLNANLHAYANLGILSPGYVFATPVLGGQLALSMAAIGGRSSADINGTLTAAAGPIVATRQGQISDSRYGIGDLYPFAALRWNSGVNNWMTFLDGDIPVGMYDSGRLANFGIGHGSVDGGGGYTYFDPQTGHEFTVATGLTYNLSNSSTDYRNGWDWHLDWGASQFLSKTIQVGAVGYVYAQFTGDQGAARFLGANLSRVAAAGPQVAFIFPGKTVQTYLSFKAYREFAADNRASGWSTWVTLSFSPAPPGISPAKEAR